MISDMNSLIFWYKAVFYTQTIGECEKEINLSREVVLGIIKILGVNTQSDGCLEGNVYNINWCVGHLLWEKK